MFKSKRTEFDPVQTVDSLIQQVNDLNTPSDETKVATISADLQQLKKHLTHNPYPVLIKRFLKLLLLIAIIKYVRIYIRSSEAVTSELQYFFSSADIESVIELLLLSAVFGNILILSMLYMFFRNKQRFFMNPIVISIFTFFFIDAVLIAIFPEVTISVLKAYLLGGQ